MNNRLPIAAKIKIQTTNLIPPPALNVPNVHVVKPPRTSCRSIPIFSYCGNSQEIPAIARKAIVTYLIQLGTAFRSGPAAVCGTGAVARGGTGVNSAGLKSVMK
jgi:hypothetical protein